MPRGNITRQPTRSGRHEGAQRVPVKIKPAKTLPPAKLRKATSGKAPKGYNPVAPGRVSEVLNRLNSRYGDVTCALHHSSAWELLVATILSAQCTDVRVNMVTPGLFKKYPTIEQ